MLCSYVWMSYESNSEQISNKSLPLSCHLQLSGLRKSEWVLCMRAHMWACMAVTMSVFVLFHRFTQYNDYALNFEQHYTFQLPDCGKWTYLCVRVACVHRRLLLPCQFVLTFCCRNLISKYAMTQVAQRLHCYPLTVPWDREVISLIHLATSTFLLLRNL